MNTTKENFVQQLSQLMKTQEFIEDFNTSVPISELLRLPSVRKWLSKKTFNEIDLARGLDGSSEAELSVARKNTVAHNINSLKQNLTLDRGAILTDRTMQFINTSDAPHIRVLHVGPRNVNEILASLSHGVIFENISALDLIQVYEFFDVGDMHKMPYEDSTFDVIIVGWVLAYSAMPSSAIQELARVAKDGAIIGVGWDFSSFDYENAGLLSNKAGITTIKNSGDILELFNVHTTFKNKVLMAEDSSYPWDGETRRNTLVFKILKSQLDLRPVLLREAMMLQKLVGVIDNIPADINQQLLGHYDFIMNYTQKLYSDEPREDYKLLRKNYIRYSGNLEEVISSEISKIFPPLFEKSSTGKSIFTGEDLSEVEYKAITDGLSTDGFAMFPRLIPEDFLSVLQEIFQRYKPESGRLLIEEQNLLRHKAVPDLLLDRAFLTIAERFLGTVPIIDFFVGMRTAENQEPNGHELIRKLDTDAMLFHFDKDRIKFLKIFIYLNDTDETNGAHELIPGSHKIIPPRDGRFSDEEARALTGKESKKIIGRAGTVFLVNTHTLHKGTPIKQGYRDVLQFEYVNSLAGAPVKPLPLSVFLPESKHMIELFPRMFMRYHQ
ncbi:phytanoyl-CoA dioxygenase family protein [Limnohabitans sp. DCL3]|uniref:phytanoyl-CoA dioxygenase family protein n=1 Tax=Limnohabitans sp. DCL3 TaxID=3374103 RepID=UPI003A842D44